VENVARRKTQALYVKVFEKVSALVAQFPPSCAVADFHEASVSAFHHVYQDAVVVGCWFHYAQAVMKRCNKIGLKESNGRNVDVAIIVHCLLSLPSFPDSVITDSKMQFLLAVSHSMGAHTESFRQRDEDSSSSSSSSSSSEEDAETEAPTATTESASADAAAADDCCEVCLAAPPVGYALMSCGHARFCET